MTKIIASSLLSKELQKRIKSELQTHTAQKNISAKDHLMNAIDENIVTKDYIIELLLNEISEKDLMKILIKHDIASDEIVEMNERLTNRFKKYGF